ncbi:MAG: hypothetical protein ACRCYE_05605 [Sarcina sp.]
MWLFPEACHLRNLQNCKKMQEMVPESPSPTHHPSGINNTASSHFILEKALFIG